MHIQKNTTHLFVWIIIATILINIISTPLVVDASILSPTANPVTAGKLIDMCLTRSGKVVNSDIREDVLNQTRNVLNDTATSYRQWCKDNGKAKSVETFREYMESDAYASLPFRLSKFPLELASFINWLIEGETLLDVIGDDVQDVLTEHDEKGNVSVPTETVNIINQCFDKVKGNHEIGWKWMDVQSSSALQSDFFEDQASYNNVKSYINGSENPTFIFASSKNGPMYMDVLDNGKSLYPVLTQSSSGLYTMTFYNENWETEMRTYPQWEWGKGQVALKDQETFEASAINVETATTGYRAWRVGRLSMTVDWGLGSWGLMYIYAKEPMQIKVYDSLQSVKDYSLGNSPYFLTNRQYSDSVDNSFNVSGEYIQNNGGTFAYEQIREQINNSNVTNESSVNNIVNDYSQTIINNYYTSSGEGGSSDNEGSGEDEDEGGGLLDGLGSVVEGMADLLGFLLKAIGEILGLIGNLFNTLFEGIKALGSIFGGFSGLLGELFPFIPTELITFVTIAIEAIIAIAVWKLFKK